jgi:universal stress protein A
MIKRILVPVDFSNPALKALDYAIEFGRPHRAEIVVVHAVEPVYYPVTADLYGPGFDVAGIFREIERTSRMQLARLATDLKRRRVPARTLLRVGGAAEVIVDAARKLKADLIILSTHGRTGLAHVLLGSVAERVVRNATCPVLTVRGGKKGKRVGGAKKRVKLASRRRRPAKTAPLRSR